MVTSQASLRVILQSAPMYSFPFPTGTVHANITTVPSCNLGPYGCCHDNETFAKGPDMEGCLPQQDQHLTPLASPISPPVLSQCQKDQQNAKNSGAADIFVPECEPSGLFKEVQCYSYPASGKTDCWCVNQNTGSEITGTRVTGLTPNCKGTYWLCLSFLHCFLGFLLFKRLGLI